MALASAMATYWTNFARSGNPNGTGVPTWADFSAGAVLGLDVASGGGIAPLTSAAFATAHKCDTTWSVLTF
jgi:para-nitrobenzyl esterase